MTIGTSLATIIVGGRIEPWLALGFAATGGDTIALPNGALHVDADLPPGIHGLTIVGCVATDIEGIPVATGVQRTATDHPNGAVEIDHLVVTTDSLERTSGAIEAALGLECRRVREAGPIRQAFHRFADVDGTRGCIIEVVERPGASTTSLWGIVVNVADIDAVGSLESVAAPKPAVQAGRLIAGVDKSAGHGVPLAFMSP